MSDYDALVRGVLEVFRPRKFTMTLFGEDSGMEDIHKVRGVIRRRRTVALRCL